MKTIECNPRKRQVSKVAYQLDVATDFPERLRNRLESFECSVRDVIPLDEANHHRLTLAVVETQHVSAEHRLDAVMGVLLDTTGAVELSRKRLDESDVRRVLFEMDVEARFINYDVERHLRLATGVSVLQFRELDGGKHACVKCNSGRIEDTSHPDRRNGGALVRCQSCGYVGSLERRPRARIRLKVRETPGVLAEERIENALAVIRSTARHFALLDLKRIDDQQGERAFLSPAPIPGDDVEAEALAEVGEE